MFITNLRCNDLVNPVLSELKSISWEYSPNFDVANIQSANLLITEEMNPLPSIEITLDLNKSSIDNLQNITIKSETKYLVQIKVLEKNGNSWSTNPTDNFFLSSADWSHVKWISGNEDISIGKSDLLFSKKLELEATVKAAKLYITACGIYECYIDNKKISADLLAPGWTSYSKHIQYQAYDIASLLNGNSNQLLNVCVGNGWFSGGLTWDKRSNLYGNRKGIIAKCVIDYENGTHQEIVTDESWVTAQGPVLSSDIYDGELFDGAHANSHWLSNQKRDTWFKAELFVPMVGQLVPQSNETCQITETINPISIFRTINGQLVIDFGQNLVGRVHIHINTPPERDGSITIKHAEVLDANGNVYFDNLRRAKQTIEYRFIKGQGIDYAAQHTFMGFRYIVIDGENLPAIDVHNFTAEVIHSNMERTGYFESSDSMLNQLYANIIWGQRGNFIDVPTDCPQRDERLGWTGDAQVFISTALYNYNGNSFFRKWLSDLKVDQLESGGVPAVIPDVIKFADNNQSSSSAAWGDAAVICPWTLYKFYGNKDILMSQYESMKKWIQYNCESGENEFSGNQGFHYGDWLALDNEADSFGLTPHNFIACCFHRYTVCIMAEVSNIVNKKTDHDYYVTLLAGIDDFFQQKYLTQKDTFPNTQTSRVLALEFMDLTEKQRASISAELNAMVINKGMHLTTGFVGTPYLLNVLTENGFVDTAVKLLFQKEYPSWMYSITKGATTIWEHWDGIKEDGSFWSDGMNSFNHYAYGAVGNWIYRQVLGIDQKTDSFGFKDILIAPPIKRLGLAYVTGSYQSVNGLINVAWNRKNNVVNMRVEIPRGSNATIILKDAKYHSLVSQNADSFTYDFENGAYLAEISNAGIYEFIYTNS